MGSNDTYELEFILFDKKAEQLIGKPVEKLSNMYGKSDTPVEITALIGQKYTFIVKISSKKSFASKDPSFEVLYITHQFGKETNIQSSDKQEQSSSSSSTISLSTSRHVPPLVPIKYKVDTKQVHTNKFSFFSYILSFFFQKKFLDFLIVYFILTYRMKFRWYRSLKQILTL
jgi:hypothetical protein